MNRAFDELQTVTIRGIWAFITTQPISFWLVCGYLFFEYVRPQSMYPAIDVLPWARTSILLAVIALVFEGRFPKLHTTASGALLLFMVIVVLSSIFAYRPDWSSASLSLPLSWLLIFLIITASITTQERFLVFMLLFLLASFKMAQFGARSWAAIGFQYRDWGVAGAPGWFSNSGELGIQMCIFIPLAVAFIWGLKDQWPQWGKLKLAFFLLFPITGVMTVIASSSRGAIVGLLVVLMWWLIFVSRRFRAAFVTVAVASAVFFFMPEEQRERFETAGDDGTSISRLDRWEDGIEMMNRHPILGVGYNNWIPYYRVYFPHRSSQGLSHNIFVEAGSELGYSGLLVFLLMIGMTFRLNWKTRRMMRAPPEGSKFLYTMAYGLDGALVGFLASGFFVTVLYYPYFWINLAMTVALYVAARNRVKTIRQAAVHLPKVVPVRQAGIEAFARSPASGGPPLSVAKMRHRIGYDIP